VVSPLTYYYRGKLVRLNTMTGEGGAIARPSAVGRARTTSFGAVMHASADRFTDLYQQIHESELVFLPEKNPAVTLVATEAITVEGASAAELKKLKDESGLRVVREGLFGKVLLRNENEGGPTAVKRAFAAARAAHKLPRVKAAHPNFVRLIDQITCEPSPPGAGAGAGSLWWNHLNDGTTGVRGADVAVRAAWTICRGAADVRVAVLDEGVDVGHPDLGSAVVAQKDFVDDNPTAAPAGNDAHGTACAGIIAGRGHSYPGITNCSLVAVRIAKGDGQGHWVFDDFATADAIDWAWKEGQADVLSNSWGGGSPVDAITNAFERARTRGRGKKGCVIAVASGNSNGPVQYPATLPRLLCVGASNQWDQRKSPTSLDGERWGSCFGPELSLVAPGVRIATTVNAGTGANYSLSFNGTSAATPHVAAAAALVLSVAPHLKERNVRDILTGEAARLTPAGLPDRRRRWNREMGWGRLDIHAALRRALRP
jgi:thermitase